MKTWLTQTRLETHLEAHLSSPHSSAKKSHPTPQNRGRLLIILIPLILSFLLVLGCAPTASTAASAPSELQQVANLITATDASLAAVNLNFEYDNNEPSAPIINITGLQNTHTGELPSWTLNIAEDPNITIGDRTPISVRPTKLIEAVTIPPKTLTVTFGTAPPVDYMLHIYISGAPIADWFTGPDITGGGKDVSRYITASFNGQAGTVTLDATTKILSVTGFTNVENGTAGSITATSAFPAGFSFDDINLPDPDGEGIEMNTITPSRATLVITETLAPSNTEPYTLATVPLAKLSKFTPGGTHITVKDNALPEDSADITTNLDFSVTPAESLGANPKITITGLTNAIGSVKTYTLTVMSVADLFTTPGGTDIIITIEEPAGFSPGLGMLSAATIMVTNQGDSEATIYDLEVRFSGAAITSWFTADTIGNYFSGATFAGQAATLTLADNVITIGTVSGMLTNVPNGLLVPTPTLPDGFTLINNFTDPDDTENPIGAVDMGHAGTLTIEEMDADTIIQSQDYPVQISLVAYTSPVVTADVTATFGSPAIPAESVTLEGVTITITGFTNIDGTSEMAGSVIFAPLGYGYTFAPPTLDIPNPEGTAATNTTIGTVTVTTTSSGVIALHTVMVKFRLFYTTLALSVTGMEVTSGETVTLADTMKCQVLTASDIAVIIDGEPNTDYSVANPPSYYDRSLLSWSTLPEATRDTAPIPVMANLEIIDAEEDVAAALFPLTVNFPQCQVADLPGADGTADDVTTDVDGTADDPYLLSKAEHLELFAHLVNNSNATYKAKHYKLAADIDLEVAHAPWTKRAGGLGFTPIGSTPSATDRNFSVYTNRFAGTFDCDDASSTDKNKVHTIANLYISNTVAYTETNNGLNKGLFGFVEGGTIQNCALVSANVTGASVVGMLIGYAQGGNTLNTYVSGTVSGEGSFVGGLIGYNDTGGNINNSYATGTVTGNDYVGGLVGTNSGAKINNSYATATVSGNDYVGGLLGYNGTSAKINNSYATGTVSGNNYVGGLLGWNDLFGRVTSSYWDTQTSMRPTSAGGTDVTGRMTAQMQVDGPRPAMIEDPSGSGTMIANPDAVYVNWNKERDDMGTLTGIDDIQWDFTAGKYPRLINVACANWQYLSVNAEGEYVNAAGMVQPCGSLP